jgi:hypothetical protein
MRNQIVAQQQRLHCGTRAWRRIVDLARSRLEESRKIPNGQFPTRRKLFRPRVYVTALKLHS